MKGGMGQATGFIFENINMTAVESPIIIDQFYCPQGNCPLKVKSTKHMSCSLSTQ